MSYDGITFGILESVRTLEGRIKYARVNQHLSVKELSEKTNISIDKIEVYENSSSDSDSKIDNTELEKLANTLKVRTSWLLGGKT